MYKLSDAAKAAMKKAGIKEPGAFITDDEFANEANPKMVALKQAGEINIIDSDPMPTIEITLAGGLKEVEFTDEVEPEYDEPEPEKPKNSGKSKSKSKGKK